MTDYGGSSRASPLKRAARALLSVTLVNMIVVAVLKRLPAAKFRVRIPVKGGVGVFLTGLSGDVVMGDTERCEIAKALFWGDGRLPSTADELSLNLAMSLAEEADVFLDIGAYSGLFALAVTRRNPDVLSYAYEIVPENFSLLVANIAANDLQQRVVPHLIGIGVGSGTVVVPKGLGSGVLPSSIALDSETRDGIVVPVQALDSLFAGFEGRMVWKVDVEGFEMDVFEGGRDLVARTKPDVICEVLRRAPKIPQLSAFLRENGYNRYRIGHGVLWHLDEIVPVKDERDWLFTVRVPNELRDLGWTVTECQ